MGDEVTTGTAFPELAAVHRRVRAAGAGSVTYRYVNNRAQVEVLVIVDVDPMQLCALIVNRDSKFAVALARDVMMPGYRIRTRLGEQYGDVLDALGVDRHRRGAAEFRPTAFFRDLIGRAPARITPAAPRDVLRMTARPVEEADKIYYLHTRHHSVESGRGPTAANLDKTEAAFGAAVRRWCQEHRISTCWGTGTAGGWGAVDLGDSGAAAGWVRSPRRRATLSPRRRRHGPYPAIEVRRLA